MRISDWSSDVCASDLRCRHEVRDQHAYGLQRHVLGIRRHQLEAVPTDGRAVGELELTVDRAECRQTDVLALLHRVAGRVDDAQCVVTGWHRFQIAIRRSEEHTSELRSLMRISYAVFCLKKKNITQSTTK